MAGRCDAPYTGQERPGTTPRQSIRREPGERAGARRAGAWERSKPLRPGPMRPCHHPGLRPRARAARSCVGPEGHRHGPTPLGRSRTRSLNTRCRRGGESNPWTCVRTQGCVDGSRTRDNSINSRMLYQAELRRMVNVGGLEPPAYGLRARCSATELHVQTVPVPAPAYGGDSAAPHRTRCDLEPKGSVSFRTEGEG